MKLSSYQKDILKAVETTNDCLLIQAVAGSGKTTTLVECMKFIKTHNTIFIAFNKIIAEDLAKKIPENFTARTFHSVCFEAWRQYCLPARLGLDEDKTWKIIWKTIPSEEVPIYGHFCKQLVAYAKNNGLGTDLLEDTDDAWEDIIEHHLLQLHNQGDMKEAIKYSRTILAKSIEKKNSIDFDDMIYLPLLFGAPFNRYEVIFVDEAQDLSYTQHALLESMLLPDGRIIVIGDENQSIYGFRSADSESMKTLGETFCCVEMPLSISYRCDKKIVDAAKKYVPHIESHAYAADGCVDSLDKYNLDTFDNDDVIICRNTSPLVRMAYGFLRRGRKIRFLGNEIGEELIALIEKMKTEDVDELLVKLEKWKIKKTMKANASAAALESILDRAECIKICCELLVGEERTIENLVYEIAKIFKETDGDLLTLCTGHKSKGREWDHVFWLDEGLIPSKYAKNEWMLKQENNLAYVITTRAKHHLTYISSYCWESE